MTPTVTLRAALSDPALLGGVLGGTSWRAWRCVDRCNGRGVDRRRARHVQTTDRPRARTVAACRGIGRHCWSTRRQVRAMATLATYIAALCKHDLVRGEVGVSVFIAPDQRQATIALNFAEAAFEQSPILRQLIASRTSDTLTLTNGISIEVRASSFQEATWSKLCWNYRRRGGVLAYSDEFSANADAEILNAVRPGLATTGGPLIIAYSPVCQARRIVRGAPAALRPYWRSADVGGARWQSRFPSDAAAGCC